MRKNAEVIIDYSLFDKMYNEICLTERYLGMKEHIAHADVSTFDHSVNVARACYTYVVDNKIKCDLKALIKAASKALRRSISSAITTWLDLKIKRRFLQEFATF